MTTSCYMCKGNVSSKLKLYLGTNGSGDIEGNEPNQAQPRPINFEEYAPINAFNFNEE